MIHKSKLSFFLPMLLFFSSCEKSLEEAQVGKGKGFITPTSLTRDDNGFFYVTDRGLLELIKIHPKTGDREQIDLKDQLNAPTGIAHTKTDIYIVDPGMAAVLKVNSRNSEIISGKGRGKGPLFMTPRSIAIAPDGTIYVADLYYRDVFKIDPKTGDRTLLSGISSAAPYQLIDPWGIQVLSNGKLLVADSGSNAIVVIDPTNNERTAISLGNYSPLAIAVDERDHLYFTDFENQAILQFHFDNQKFEVISSLTIGRGVPLFVPMGIFVSDQEIFVIDLALQALIKINPYNGDRKVVSGVNRNFRPRFLLPFSVDMEPDGSLVVADPRMDSIIRVEYGLRSFLSRPGFAQGPLMITPEDIFVDPFGDTLLSDATTDTLMHVQQRSGRRSVVSGPTKGLGPYFADPFSLVQNDTHSIYVSDSTLNQIFHVEPGNGNRSILSSNQKGNGPPFHSITGIDLDDQGMIIVADRGSNSLLVVDPNTGDRTILSSESKGKGPLFKMPMRIKVISENTIAVTDPALESVFLVNRYSGNRKILSGPKTGSGPELEAPIGITYKKKRLIVTDLKRRDLVEIDLLSGDRKVVPE